MNTFKSRLGFTEVNRPNRVTGTAKRHMRVTPAPTSGAPLAGPSVFEPFVPTHTAGLYFADDDDQAGQLFEANLHAAVLAGEDAYRRADLELAAFFAGEVAKLRAERSGLAPRAGSRAGAPLELFISLEERYSLQAGEIRERWGHTRREIYSDDSAVRDVVARDPYATTEELKILAKDDDSAVRTGAQASLEDRAE